MIDVVAFVDALASEVRVTIARGTLGFAVFSTCGKYRYLLTRTAAGLAGRGRVSFVMLNPSIADADQNDPTIRRCIGYATAWGYAELLIANAHAWRSTDPDALYGLTEEESVGELNDAAIRAVARLSDLVVCGWGNHGALRDRGHAVLGLIDEVGKTPHSLKVTKTGQPSHPLYLAKGLKPVPWMEP